MITLIVKMDYVKKQRFDVNTVLHQISASEPCTRDEDYLNGSRAKPYSEPLNKFCLLVDQYFHLKDAASDQVSSVPSTIN